MRVVGAYSPAFDDDVQVRFVPYAYSCSSGVFACTILGKVINVSLRTDASKHLLWVVYSGTLSSYCWRHACGLAG